MTLATTSLLKSIFRLIFFLTVFLGVLASCSGVVQYAEEAIDVVTPPARPLPGLALTPDKPAPLDSTQPLSQSTPAPIGYDEIVIGEISDENHQYLWTFMGMAGEVITIVMTRASGDLDTYLELLDSQGVRLASDDDGANDTDSIIKSYRLESSESYTIIATRYRGPDGTSSGRYTLLVYREYGP